MYSAERHFVTTAHAQLRFLAADVETDSADNQPAFDMAIAKIKQASGPIKARAVYRAALLCEDVLKRCSSAQDVKFQTALARLNSLVTLYTQGLYEIDPEFKSIVNGDAPKETAPLITSPEIKQTNLKAANQNAATILKPLLRLVKENDPQNALTFLSGYGQQPNAELSPRQTHVRFDALMRHVTNSTLGVARAKAKNVSISYGADFETLDAALAPNMQKLLQIACAEIVQNGLVITGDLISSLNRNWQISVTGETSGQNLIMKLGWRGQALPHLNEQGKHALERLGGKVSMQAKRNGVELENNGTEAHIMRLTCPLKIAEILPPRQKIQARIRKG